MCVQPPQLYFPPLIPLELQTSNNMNTATVQLRLNIESQNGFVRFMSTPWLWK